jgi:hypothetical protein
MVSSRSKSTVRRVRALIVITLSIAAAFAFGPVRALSAAAGTHSARDVGDPVVDRGPRDFGTLRVTAGSRVVLWGDSLAFEAQEPFVAELIGHSDGRLQTETHTFGGTATCDWLDDMQRTARDPIAAAVLEFSGNALTRCMRDAKGVPLTGTAFLAAYRSATMRAISMLRSAGARVYLAGAPLWRTPSDDDAHRLRALYQDLARTMDGVEYVDAGASVLTAAGRWTATLPCLADEGAAQGCVDGRIIVRAPDGRHFCPGSGPAVGGVTAECPRYSSGARRYGRAMADAVMNDVRFVAVT